MDHPGSDKQSGSPLEGRTVLIPRSLDRAVGLAARLHELGARVLVTPVIERAPADDTEALDAAVRDLADGRFTWTLVTSVNAIGELAASWRRVSPESPSLVGAPTRWAAVGPATARGLREVGVEPALVPAENSALGLLTALRSFALEPHDATGVGNAAEATSSGAGTGAARNAPHVLLPLGDLARPTLANGLTAMGARPHVVTAYRTVTHVIEPAVADAWRAGEVDAVVLTSGSVVREIAVQLGPRDDVLGVAIGAPTRRAAAEAGLRVDAVATTPDDAGLAVALTRAFTSAPPALSERAGAMDHRGSDNSTNSQESS